MLKLLAVSLPCRTKQTHSRVNIPSSTGGFQMRKTCVFVGLLLLCVSAAHAKVTCAPPLYIYGAIDGVTFDAPEGLFWTVRTYPFLECDELGANCSDYVCVGGGDCSDVTIGGCYLILLSSCSSNPGVTVVRSWAIATSGHCQP
jgi:hypothetical protein